jgi:prepilin-type N-terminal cleavage/methylation domain-containing protein
MVYTKSVWKRRNNKQSKGGFVKKGWNMRAHRGFTLIEIIVVLIVLGIIAAIVITRAMSTEDVNKVSQTNVIKNHIRYAQSMAMKQAAIWGLKCDGSDYWLFTTSDPDTGTNQKVFPGEANAKISLSGKKITMSAYTLFFDANGRPYTAYTDATTNTPVSAANPLSVTVNSVPAGVAATFGIAPETGFMP